MELRTTFKIDPSAEKITYDDPVMFIGSCFAISIGKQFETGHLPVMINPSGTVYNPVSVINTLDTILDSKEYTDKDLYNDNGTWLSFNHYTDFSSDNKEEILKNINDRSREARESLSKAKFLFITFGTARVYRWKESGKIVSNCHKIQASQFTHELLAVEDIVNMWTRQLDRLKSLYPRLRVVFTISPVRHWKDGPHGNQVSKSTLFLAVEKLLDHPSHPGYFPAYELVMDDLRDYRFYDNDLLHPSETAVEYLWNSFSDCYFDNETIELWKEIDKIARAVSHRIGTGSSEKIKTFAKSILKRIDSVSAKKPSVNLASERKYFLDLIEGIPR
ncbi:MAG: GSCFA domain-containing protein [Bacteroidia bacterium]|nr:GSCFA domain-containing protein [Bacteroidia bacterium]